MTDSMLRGRGYAWRSRAALALPRQAGLRFTIGERDEGTIHSMKTTGVGWRPANVSFCGKT